MKVYILIFILIIYVFSGDPERVGSTSINFSKNPQTTGINAINSIGFSNLIVSSVAEISHANPASLCNFSQPSLGLLFNYAPPQNIFYSYKLKRTKQYLPYSAGFVYPISNICLAVGYHKKYSHSIDLGEIPLTTIEEPEGTGITFSPKFIAELHSLSFSGCYNYSNLFMNDDNISVGLQMDVDYLYVKEQVSSVAAKVSDMGLSGKLGLNYKFSDFISFGILYSKGSYIKSEMEYEGSGLEEQISTDSSTIYLNMESINQKYVFELPDKFSYGFFTVPFKRFYFSLTISHIFWNRINSYFDNSIDISSNVIYKVPYSRIDLTCGIFDRKENSDLFDFNNDLFFLNFGIRQNFNNSAISVDISDGYNSSWDRLDQYFLSLNADFIFN
ncbi:MAG: hypothetical protein P8Y99_16745 [Calditrichaceae bacterium]